MIVGHVNSRREAVIQFAVLGENNQRQGVKAIIDTGYTGFLTLPSAVIATLELTWFIYIVVWGTSAWMDTHSLAWANGRSRPHHPTLQLIVP